MMMPGRNLRLALLATLAATVWAALQPEDEPSADMPAPRRAAQRAAPDQAGAGKPSRGTVPPRQAAAAPRSGWPAAPEAHRDPDLAATSHAALAAWQPLPPPPAPSPAPVAAPTAPAVAVPAPPPAFPYTLIGRVQEDGQVQVLLSSPLRTISARLNDTVDGQWRLESIQPGAVVFIWVSGGQRQTVSYRTS